jgi:hypothetical protein
MRTKCLPVIALALLAWTSPPGRAEEPRTSERWFYAAQNLIVEKNVEELVALLERAGKSGYNGVVLADYKFNILERQPPGYFRNVARVRDAAEKAGIEIVPAVFPIGYSNGLLAHDPNLAEGVPVKEAPFVVKGGEAVLKPDPAARVRNGDLEDVKGDRFTGFTLQDDPGRTTFADRNVVHGGKVSCRMQDVARGSSANCRLAQRVKVRPYACYRFSCWVKTEDFRPANAFRLLALGTAKGDRRLTFHEAELKPTQDWTQMEVVFNSLDQGEVQVYAGQWGGQAGKLWLDDLKLEELPLVNVLRRDGCPLVVASADGKTVYEEGKDFLPVRDEKLGREPYAGEFSFRHDGPALQLTPDSRIKDGDRLRVSWYHPVITHSAQVMCCLTEPKVYDLLREQAKRVNELFHPQTFFLRHDELRVANWCRACQATRETPGELLATNARRCVEIIRDVSPKARVVVWSDMFDPHHNAVDHYYLVNGTLEGSWKGLPPDVVIANWNGDQAGESLRFFAEHGHAQVIAGYYDGGLDNLKKWQAASRGVPRVTGFMYTTWQNRYDDLEAAAALLWGSSRP